MAKILIVDDSKFMRRIIRQAIEENGHEVIAEADNGQDGIESYKSYHPDIITMDITMGGKDGIMAVAEIKELNPDSKIIVVSALNENTIKLNENNLNADAFITKPFEKEDLINAINKILS